MTINPNKALWEKGDFTRIAESMRESGEALVTTLGISEGLEVLDLGCGDGTTALPAARQLGHKRREHVHRHRLRARNVPRLVFGFRAHVEHDHVSPRQPLLKLRGGNMLDPVPLTQVLVRQLIHLCNVADRDIADRRPEIAHPLARQPIEDPRPLPARENETRPSEYMQVL